MTIFVLHYPSKFVTETISNELIVGGINGKAGGAAVNTLCVNS